MEPYLGLGHNLYRDNWYTSPLLAHFLHINKTNTCSTVRKNRREMPNLKEPKKKVKQQVHTHKTQWFCVGKIEQLSMPMPCIKLKPAKILR